MNEYLKISDKGKNEWWRYLVSCSSIFFVFIIASIVVGIVLVILTILKDPSGSSIAAFSQTSNYGDLNIGWEYVYTLMNIPFVILLVGLFLIIRFVHHRPIHTLISATGNFDWRRFWLGFGLWFIFGCVLVSIVEIGIFSGSYKLTFEFSEWIKIIPIALILTPIQTFTEELVFRGHVLQTFGRKIKNIWFLSVISALIFLAVHLGNPEIALSLGFIPFYFSMGFVLSIITLKDKRLEFAIGMHTINNIYAALFLTYPNSAIPTPSIFTNTVNNTTFLLFSFLISSILVYMIYFKIFVPIFLKK